MITSLHNSFRIAESWLRNMHMITTSPTYILWCRGIFADVVAYPSLQER